MKPRIEEPTLEPAITLPDPEPVFRDTREREWPLELHVTLAREIREATGCDLVNWHDGKALLKLGSDVEKLVQVLWFFVCKQAEAEGISEEDFGSALGGDTLGQAESALEVALVNFSRPSQRAVMKAILARSHEETKARLALAEEKVKGQVTSRAMAKGLAKLGAELDRQIEKSTAGK